MGTDSKIRLTTVTAAGPILPAHSGPGQRPKADTCHRRGGRRRWYGAPRRGPRRLLRPLAEARAGRRLRRGAELRADPLRRRAQRHGVAHIAGVARGGGPLRGRGDGRPVLVTEHGLSTEDDDQRCRFLPEALAGLDRARADGVAVIGYCHWTFLDNFEWVSGYGPKFGLHAVDRDTLERTPKESSRVYAAEIAARCGHRLARRQVSVSGRCVVRKPTPTSRSLGASLGPFRGPRHPRGRRGQGGGWSGDSPPHARR